VTPRTPPADQPGAFFVIQELSDSGRDTPG
jgi:hypothetical protein